MNEEMQKTVTKADAFAQTEPMTGATFVEQMDWDRVNERAETYKSQYQKCATAYNGLKDRYQKLYEKSTSLKVQHDQNLVNYNGLQTKYEKTKEICNNRFKLLNDNEEKIAEFVGKIEELNENEAKLKNELISLREETVDMVVYKQLKSKYDELKAQNSKIMKKCEETANTLDDVMARYGQIKIENDSLKKFEVQSVELADELNQLKDKLKKYKSEFYAYRSKYHSAKELLEKRFYRIKYLQELLDTNDFRYDLYVEKNDENVPNNRVA